MSFPLSPHNGQGFPHCSFPSYLELISQVANTGLQLRELRVRAQLDATSATWLADQLEQAGLIERKRNDPDRRAVRIW